MKKFMAALLGFLFLFNILYSLPAVAQDNTQRKLTLEEAIDYANQELGGQYYSKQVPILINGAYQIKELNRKIWDDRDILVYGQPTDVCKSEKDFDKSKSEGDPGYYRYLGYTKGGDLIPDPDFREDHTSQTLINNYDWKREPWRREYGLATGKEMWDNNSENLQYIKAGLYDEYKADIPRIYNPEIKPRNANTGDDDWHTVTKILQPRTKYTPGLARMWHNWNGSYWYITVFVPNVLPPDIEVTALNNANTVNVKTKQTASVNYRNNSSESQTFEAIFYVDANSMSTESLTLAAGQDITKSYEWTAPDAAGKVTLKAEARPVPDEKNLANNSKTLAVTVNDIVAPKAPDSLPCKEIGSISNTWGELYQWQVYHPQTTTYTDPVTGQSYDEDTSWWEQKSAAPTYQETLSATLTVNTKQGIANGDRESRGAWEIIPYAKKNHLDPNEVTRAGYGFEVKVVTAYDNDWESKAPAGAEAHGGTFKGPDKVQADFYDTKGRFVKRVSLVPTHGSAGDNNITWELPSQKYTFKDGTSVYERKHYVDVNMPDGKYQVKITVSGAGKTDLCLIQKKYITIYGDMYDDSYTRVSTGDE